MSDEPASEVEELAIRLYGKGYFTLKIFNSWVNDCDESARNEIRGAALEKIEKYRQAQYNVDAWLAYIQCPKGDSPS